MKVIHVVKRKAYLLLSTALCFAFISTYLMATLFCLSGKIIVIDAGHGGIDPGANRPGVLEKEINLAVCLQLKNILHEHGAKVVLTLESDIDLSDLCDNEKIKGRYDVT